MRRLIAFLTVLLLSGWAGVSAQSLVEVAKKEKERRKRNNAAKVHSFKESDLRSRGGGLLPQPVTPPPEGGEPSTSQSEEPEEEEDEVDPAKTEAYWRNRLAPIDRRIADIRSQLNAPGFSEDPTNLSRRQRLERDLERAQTDRQAVLEEARRKGVPSGWLR